MLKVLFLEPATQSWILISNKKGESHRNCQEKGNLFFPADSGNLPSIPAYKRWCGWQDKAALVRGAPMGAAVKFLLTAPIAKKIDSNWRSSSAELLQKPKGF